MASISLNTLRRRATTALTPGMTIAIVIFGCAALCLYGYAMWAVISKRKVDNIENTRPQRRTSSVYARNAAQEPQGFRSRLRNARKAFARLGGLECDRMSLILTHRPLTQGAK
jgi:hypothetical protein